MRRFKVLNKSLIAAAILAGVFAVIFWANVYLFELTCRRAAAGLIAAAEKGQHQAFRYKNLETLPAPVARYLKKVIPAGRPDIRIIRMEQSGRFSMETKPGRWAAFSATQHYTTKPIGSVWDARIEYTPTLTARVLDMYKGGMGSIRGKLFGFWPLVDERGRRELDQSDLVRYLAETVWFPTALLPDRNLRWEAVDDRNAVAVLNDAGYEVRATFHFNVRDEVEWITANRYRFLREKKRYRLTGWIARYNNYEMRDGIIIPLEGSAWWELPEGNQPYWKGRIEAIEYE